MRKIIRTQKNQPEYKSEVRNMAEYYFDTETTGFDFDKDRIITIQWQRLGFSGEPIGELNILKSWESSEKEIIENFRPNLTCYLWEFVFVGKNLTFDFNMLNERMKHHNLGEFDLRCLHQRVTLDIKPLLVLINNGKFVGYDKVLPKTNPVTNDKIGQLYKDEEYSEIIQYIKDEAKDFTKAYQIFRKEIPSLKKYL